MKVVNLRAYADRSDVPTLVLIEMQQEYLAAPRGLALPRTTEALSNCRLALAHARKMGFPTAFVRWRGRSPFFNAATQFSRWIEGFEPLGSDMIFERDQPSCYASPQFAEVMTTGGGSIVIAGFAGETSCLSTAVDAFHRGHRITFLADASGSHDLEELSGDYVHRVISKVVGLYGDVVETKSWVSSSSQWGRAGRA